MKLFPAIDILGGSAVRLVQGDFDEKTVYDEDPLAAARAFVAQGARNLHVVDLDGAKRGEPASLEHLRAISGLGVPVQYGGGLRSAESVAAALESGAQRVIVGTAAFTDPAMLERALARHGAERVLVSIDVRNGHVATHGWLQSSEVRARDAFSELRARGVSGFVFTNIDRDGMLDGANREEAIWAARQAGDGSVIYSGGIGSLADLEQLAGLRSEMGLEGLAGVIVGKALYERRFTVAQALDALGG